LRTRGIIVRREPSGEKMRRGTSETTTPFLVDNTKREKEKINWGKERLCIQREAREQRKESQCEKGRSFHRKGGTGLGETCLELRVNEKKKGGFGFTEGLAKRGKQRGAV